MGGITEAIGKGVSDITGGLTGANAQAEAAQQAARTQAGASQAAIEEQRRQFNQMQQNLQPYMGGGTSALSQYMSLLGLGAPQASSTGIPNNVYGGIGSALNAATPMVGGALTGPAMRMLPPSGSQEIQTAQASETDPIAQLRQNPLYQAMMQEGTNAILANAAATGGVRGGNVQNALAENAQNVLGNVYQQQLSNLGNLMNLGQSSAAGVGTAGLNTASNIGNLLAQQGAATAGGQLAAGNKQAQTFNQALQLGGLAAGMF